MDASMTKKKHVCRSCRQRKKRCDGAKPSCSLCQKLNISCTYIIPNTKSDCTKTGYTNQMSSARQSPWEFNENCNNANLAHLPNQFYVPPQGVSNLQKGHSSSWTGSIAPDKLDGSLPEQPLTKSGDTATPEISLQQADIKDFQFVSNDAIFLANLPQTLHLLELVELFFLHAYAFLPCFHKSELVKDVESGVLESQAPSLLYIVAAISAKFHPDTSIQACSKDWFEQAKFLYELTQRDSLPALRILQTGVCIIYHAWTVGDYSTFSLAIGKTWTQTCSYGMNQLDADPKDRLGLTLGPIATDGREKDEFRRVLWNLFFLDRDQSWPTGWPHSIPDRYFFVNFPAENSDFQFGLIENESQSIPFHWNLNKLITPPSGPIQHTNMYHCLIKAYTILGRTTDHIHALHDMEDPKEFSRALESLDSHLVRFRLSLPRSATSIQAASPAHYSDVVWLMCILNTITILLHYRPCPTDEPTSNDNHFLHSVSAARNTVQVIKDASRISPEPLLNPHISGALYVACAVLLVQWRESKDNSLKAEIDILILVFDRFHDVFPSLGNKFRGGVAFDLARDEESVRNLKRAGAKGLLRDCAAWAPHILPTV